MLELKRKELERELFESLFAVTPTGFTHPFEHVAVDLLRGGDRRSRDGLDQQIDREHQQAAIDAQWRADRDHTPVVSAR